MKKRANIKHKTAGRTRRFARRVPLVTGTAFKKALSVLIPPEILRNSSFFGGLNRMGDAIVSLGSKSKDKQGKQYAIRHSGGAVADVAIGVVFLGVPVTLVTSLFSDGCKVVHHIFKGAKTDEHTAYVGEFFGDLGTISDNFMRLFDVPSREAAKNVRSSIEKTIERLDKEGRLTDKMRKDLKDLENMATCDMAEGGEWCVDIQQRLCKIAEQELTESRVEMGVRDIRHFINEPTVESIATMRDGIVKDLDARGIAVKKTSMDFVDKLIDSLESLSKEEFQNKMTAIMIKNHELLGRTQDAIEDATYYGYQLLHSLFTTTYRGVSIFGKHYKKQLKALIRKERQHRPRRSLRGSRARTP